jgi:aryl-alcohol dehydrogenase-like predicted oxidoreductase
MCALDSSLLGRTGVRVSRLGYGSLDLGGKGTRSARYVDPKVAEAVLNSALDAGINLIDTAPDYGEAEEVIGRYISSRREEYLLASKCGCPVGALGALPPPPGRPREHNYTPENIRAGVEQSLARMRTDRLDLVQVHESPTRSTMEAHDSIGELLRLKDEGKVRFIGISSTLPNVLEHLSMDVFDSFQVPYSAFQPEYEQIISRAAANGAGVIVRGGVAQGSVAITPDEVPPHRQDQARVQNDLWDRAGLDKLLGETSRMDFLLRFTLRHPGVTSVIIGTANPAHVSANVEAASRDPLPPAVYEEAGRRLAEARTSAGTVPTYVASRSRD